MPAPKWPVALAWPQASEPAERADPAEARAILRDFEGDPATLALLAACLTQAGRPGEAIEATAALDALDQILAPYLTAHDSDRNTEKRR